MQFRRLSIVLFALLGAAHPAHADLLSRALLQGAQAGGAAAPPQSSDDLTAWAGPSRQTTLPELLQHAARNAPSLASAKLDIAIAEARIQQTQGRDDWVIDATFTIDSAQQYVAGISLDRNTIATLDARVTKPLPTGGTIGLRGFNRFERGPDPFMPTMTIDNWSDAVTLNLTQPLLRGAGTFLYNANERKATLSRDAAVLARRLEAINTVQTVIAAYWDLVFAERQVAITRASLDLAKERLRITQIGTDGGKVPRSEIPAVQQIIATREEDVLNGELAVLDRSIILRRAVGMPIGKGELGLRLGADLVVQDATWDLGQLTDRAYASSPELAQFARQDAIAKIDVEVSEKGLLPQLDAALSIGPEGQDDKFGQAWRNTAEFKSIRVGGSLTFQHSIGQENAKGLAREFRETRRKIAVTATDVRAQIAQTMARSVAQAELARRRVALSQRAIDLATENIKIETDRFNLGKATNFDVLNRQEELRQAELRKVQAMIDWHKAEAAVQALTGDILPVYGVAVD